MNKEPNSTLKKNEQAEFSFETMRTVVSEHFQIEEALLEHNIPTFYLKQPQETKQAFLNLLKKLEERDLIAFLRKVDERLVLKIFPKPISKPIDVKINWLLLLATIGTTFTTGYILSINLVTIGGAIDPVLGGIMFTTAIMAILGLHEMGHKLTANKNRIEATPPYFIPGPPPTFGGIGTFGAVIVQKSLPPNKDALFDIGLSGPIVSFILAVVMTAIGSVMAISAQPVEGAATLPTPLITVVIWMLLSYFRLTPSPSQGQILYMHPVEFAGWVGLLITVLNLLPAAMLDGGHIARSLVGDKARVILTAASILLLVAGGFWLMALFVLFLSSQRHPGPLDDVSSLSRGRKILAGVLVVIFVLAFPILQF